MKIGDNSSNSKLGLEGWLPCRVFWEAGEPMVEWIYAGRERFTDPFYEISIGVWINRPFNALFRKRTPIADLTAWARESPGVSPTGFIFHLSRCGSTLISQQLAALERCIVLSEPTPVDTILGSSLLHPETTDEQRSLWLRSMVSALMQPRNDETAGFIKFDSWHTIDLPLIRRAYPEVPMIFLYREPSEVIVSHWRMPGAQMVPGSVAGYALGIAPNDPSITSQEEYMALVLQRICSGVIASGVPIRLVNYTELPELTYSAKSNFFKFELSDSDRAKIIAVSSKDAKQPRVQFTSDSAQKQSRITDAIRKAADSIVGPIYQELEKLRASQDLEDPLTR